MISHAFSKENVSQMDSHNLGNSDVSFLKPPPASPYHERVSSPRLSMA